MVKVEMAELLSLKRVPYPLTLLVPETKIAEFANSIDPDEVAHNEPPHLDLTVCLLVFEFSNGYSLDLRYF